MGKKFATDESFFTNWNPLMAYVLGFIYADGCMYISSRGSYISITSTDKEIILKIKRWLKSGHRICVSKSPWPKGKLRYALRIGNKSLYQSLICLGLHPNKSLTTRMPLVPPKFLKDFVRGYFDGDGCVHIGKRPGKKQKLILNKLSIIFTSGSKKFLEDLLSELRETLALKQNKIYNSRRSLQLRFNTSDSLIIFKFLYRHASREMFFIRKFKVFNEYFKLRPQRIDKEIKDILNRVMA